MQQPQQTPAQLEQQWLTQLEAQNQLTVTRHQNAFSGNRPATLQEITSWINYLHDQENLFRTYEPMALYLKNAGFPRLSERVLQVIADVQGATKRYMEMYQSILDTQAKIGSIQQETNQTLINSQRLIVENRQRASEKSFKQWEATVTNSCPYCGYYLGDSYYANEVCPRCGRLLRGGY